MFEENYDKIDDALQAVKATMDDVDSAIVFFTKTLVNNEGEPIPEIGMVLNYCTGRQGVVSKTVAACVLNDGVFSRLRIPVKFV